MNDAETTGQLHAKEWSWTSTSRDVYIYIKKLKMDQNLNVKAKSITLLEKNLDLNLCDLTSGNSFLDMIPRA